MCSRPPPPPACAFIASGSTAARSAQCVVFNRTGSAFDFYISPTPTPPSPAPVQYWLRLVPESSEAELLDVTAQAQSAVASGPNVVTYSGVPDPKRGASLITVYADPADPDALYTYEEEVEVNP